MVVVLGPNNRLVQHQVDNNTWTADIAPPYDFRLVGLGGLGRAFCPLSL